MRLLTVCMLIGLWLALSTENSSTHAQLSTVERGLRNLVPNVVDRIKSASRGNNRSDNVSKPSLSPADRRGFNRTSNERLPRNATQSSNVTTATMPNATAINNIDQTANATSHKTHSITNKSNSTNTHGFKHSDLNVFRNMSNHERNNYTTLDTKHFARKKNNFNITKIRHAYNKHKNQYFANQNYRKALFFDACQPDMVPANTQIFVNWMPNKFDNTTSILNYNICHGPSLQPRLIQTIRVINAKNKYGSAPFVATAYLCGPNSLSQEPCGFRTIGEKSCAVGNALLTQPFDASATNTFLQFIAAPPATAVFPLCL